MAAFHNEILIDASADEVWAVVAAAERQAEWFPGMVSSTVDGDIRTIGTAERKSVGEGKSVELGGRRIIKKKKKRKKKKRK